MKDFVRISAYVHKSLYRELRLKLLTKGLTVADWIRQSATIYLFPEDKVVEPQPEIELDDKSL